MIRLLPLLFVFFSPTLWADNIYVSPVKGTNVDENELATVHEVIKNQVESETGNKIVNSVGEADYMLQPKLVKLGTYTLTMSKWKGDKMVNSGQWRAADLPALETTITNAVNDIVSGKKEPKSIGQQAKEKKQRYGDFERIPVRRQVLVGFGPAFFSKMNEAKTNLGFQLGYSWSIDDYFDLSLLGDLGISTEHSDAYGITAKIATNYYFMPQDTSPYIGLGFGYGWISAHDDKRSFIVSDDNANGFAGSVQAGVRFFRLSTVNFSVGGEYTTIFAKTTHGQPGIFLGKVSVFF